MDSQASTTYEAKKAQEWNASQADKIHWEKGHAFRNQNYRQLFHQRGRTGTFAVRLLEAADLKRSYWSALALGPMKHLGLSKAHGGVSSFVSFCLDTSTGTINSNTSSSFPEDDPLDLDRKMPAKSTSNKYKVHKPKNPLHQMPAFTSPVKQQDSNPVWTNCQFELPLKKGVLEDGQPVRIFLRVDEDSTAIENIIPGIPSGGNDRLLGCGTLDVTSLCLGQDPLTGRSSAGVIDEWVPIRLPADMEDSPLKGTSITEQEMLLQHAKNGRCDDLKKPPKNKKKQEARNKITGRVRILVTYHPHGIHPQQHDIVALEAFARQNLRTATCNSILPPLLPMNVREVSEPWLLVEYTLPFDMQRSSDHPHKDDKACMRIHRNSVFVIERKNFMDATLNIALQPADFLLSTPLGHGVQDVLGPVFVAGKHLMMPALLSSKLVWMAVRTTALASITGVAAAGSAFVSEGTNSLTDDGSRRHKSGGKSKYISL
ncbi:MAG: hypothetical protein SGILL_001139 [Bacillariaceae sp.]